MHKLSKIQKTTLAQCKSLCKSHGKKFSDFKESRYTFSYNRDLTFKSKVAVLLSNFTDLGCVQSFKISMTSVHGNSKVTNYRDYYQC